MVRFIVAAAAATIALSISAGAGSSEAAGGTERLYLYDYYFDAALTQYAGVSVDECVNGVVVPGQVYGTQTQYFRREWIGNCPGFLF